MPATSDPPSTPAARVAALRRSSAPHHQALRFVLNGGVVAVFHVGAGLLLAGPLGVTLQAAIPIAYVASLLLNYVLQRLFVFAHAERFATRLGVQFLRYLAVAGAQYGSIVLATTALPGPLGVSDRVVYVAAALLTPLLSFVALRAFVFHGDTDAAVEAESAAELH